ncbi:MAG: hypothetical protein RL591_403 [Planctomycetota bacterium]
MGEGTPPPRSPQLDKAKLNFHRGHRPEHPPSTAPSTPPSHLGRHEFDRSNWGRPSRNTWRLTAHDQTRWVGGGVENLFGSAFATVGAADARLATRSATRFNPRFRLVDGASEAPMRLANAERRYRHQTPTSDRDIRSRRVPPARVPSQPRQPDGVTSSFRRKRRRDRRNRAVRGSLLGGTGR